MRRFLLAAVLAALLLAPAAQAWTWPAAGAVLQSFLFDPAHPYAAGQHRGIAIGGSPGASVLAPTAGTVTFAGSVPSSGKSVTISTADGYAVTLTHLGSITLARGATVAEGDGVGTIGATGDADIAQPYVHLGVRIAAQPQGYLDPLTFLPARVPAPAALVPPVPVADPPPALPPVADPAPAPEPELAPVVSPASAPDAAAPVAAEPAAAESAAQPAPSAPSVPVDAPAPTPAVDAAPLEASPVESSPVEPPVETQAVAPPVETPAVASSVEAPPVESLPAEPPAAPRPAEAQATIAPDPAPAPVTTAPVPPVVVTEPAAPPAPASAEPVGEGEPAHGSARVSVVDAPTAAAPAASEDIPRRGAWVAAPAAERTPDRPATDARWRASALQPPRLHAMPRAGVARRTVHGPAVQRTTVQRTVAHHTVSQHVVAHPTRAYVHSARAKPVAAIAPRFARHRGGLVLPVLAAAALLAAAVLAEALGAIRMMVRCGTDTQEDPGRSGVAVCSGPPSPRTCGGVRRSVGRVRPLSPPEGQRRPHGERHGRARHAGDGGRRQGGQVLR
jgi:hypothetical protein